MMAVVIRTQPYARGESGLAAVLAGPSRRTPLAVGLVGCIALLVGWNWRAGAAAAVASLATAALVVRFARRRIGGYTGDVLGAAGILSETVGLVVAAARW
jgi:adenosylcobinamide-GDP ribazoletransferase